MATIKDVAEKAGVSISTVSLVINGKRNISKEKYKLIRTAMKELDYRPSIIAQNLKKQKFHLIGVVLPSNGGYYAQILKGIHDTLASKKYHIVLSLTDDDIQKEINAFEEFISMGVSGIISVPCDTYNTEKYKNWTGSSFPIIFIERKMEDIEFSNVFFDNQKIVYNKTKELLKSYSPGEIALITDNQEHSNEKECVVGFVDAIKDAFPDFDTKNIEIMETTLKHYRAMHDILSRYGKDECGIRCFIVTGTKIADILAELQDVMKHDSEIHALSGDVWSQAKRNKSAVHEIPREAVKMGQQAACLLMEFLKKHRLGEKRDILVEDNYDYRESVRNKSVSKKNITPLKILLLKSNAMDVLYKLSPNFMKETGIPVEFDFAHFYDLIHQLADPVAMPDYDVVWVDMPLVNTMTKMGRLLELTPLLENDERDILSEFPKGVLECIVDEKGNIFGLPLLMDEELLYFRKDVFTDPAVKWSFFDKYGFELSPPGNWAEFNCVAEFFNPAYNKDSIFKYGTALSLTSPTAVMEEFYIRQWAFNGRMIDRWNRLNIFSIENIRALENLIVSYRHSPRESLDFFFEESFTCLLKGEAPMVPGFPTHYMPFRHPELYNNFIEHIGVAPIPGGQPVLGGWVIGINSASRMPAEAYEFLCWAVSKDLMTLKGLLGHLIPIQATYDSTLLNNYYPGLKMMNVARFSKELREEIRNKNGELVEHFKFEQIIGKEIVGALNGEQSASDALKKAHTYVDNFLRS